MTEKPRDGTEGKGRQITLAEEIRSGTGLQAVSRLFQSLVKHPDRILIPNPADRANSIVVNALIIPGTLLGRLPADILTIRINREQTVSGTLVALFIPGSPQPVQYRLYPKLLPDEQGGKVLYRPSHAPLKTHEIIYDNQEPAVQKNLILITVNAIYLKQKQEQQAAAIIPPRSKIF